MILNDDAFPNGFTGWDDRKQMVGLIWGFLVQLKDCDPTGTKICLLMKLYPGVGFLISQLIVMQTLNVYIPDIVKDPDSDYFMVYLWVGIYMLSLVLWHASGWIFARQSLAGKARQFLRWSCVCTMMQLEPDKYDEFSTGEVVNIMGAGVEKAVLSVWQNSFDIVEGVATLLVMVGLMLYISFHQGFGYTRNYFVLFPVAMIMIDIIIVRVRVTKQTKLFTEYMVAEDAWKGKVASYAELRQALYLASQCAKACSRVHAHARWERHVRWERHALHPTCAHAGWERHAKWERHVRCAARH